MDLERRLLTMVHFMKVNSFKDFSMAKEGLSGLMVANTKANGGIMR